MKFELTDRIIAYEPGVSLRAIKALSLAEEYLQDHFPGKPIMPGVLMVETMVQACAWMVRLETRFAPSIVVLKEARKVNYIGMVRPGDLLTMDVRLVRMADGRAQFHGEGCVEGEKRVSGRLELEYFSLADKDPSMADVDERVRQAMRRRFGIINALASAEVETRTG